MSEKMYGVRLPTGKMYDAAWRTIEFTVPHAQRLGGNVVALKWIYGPDENPTMFNLTDDEKEEVEMLISEQAKPAAKKKWWRR